MTGMRVREATSDDLVGVMTVLDAGLLDVDVDVVRERIDDGDVLVSGDDGPVIGALVLQGNEVDAVAVTPGRRGTGIGTRLVEAAADRRTDLVAEFDADVRGFWASLGFEIEPVGNGRYRGRR